MCFCHTRARRRCLNLTSPKKNLSLSLSLVARFCGSRRDAFGLLKDAPFWSRILEGEARTPRAPAKMDVHRARTSPASHETLSRSGEERGAVGDHATFSRRTPEHPRSLRRTSKSGPLDCEKSAASATSTLGTTGGTGGAGVGAGSGVGVVDVIDDVANCACAVGRAALSASRRSIASTTNAPPGRPSSATASGSSSAT